MQVHADMGFTGHGDPRFKALKGQGIGRLFAQHGDSWWVNYADCHQNLQVLLARGLATPDPLTKV